MYDIIVVGGGPAGMTAALYGLRGGKSVLVIEKDSFGGQITHSPRVENYPALASVSGNEYAEKLMDQILAQGAEIEIDRVTGIEPFQAPGGGDGSEAAGKVKGRSTCWLVSTEEGGAFEGRSVILATGVKHRMLGLPGEEDLIGEGISFCAVCDADFYAGQNVCVVGGGDAALQEAILLSEKCGEVTVIHRRPYFTGEQKLQDILFSRPNVQFIMGAKIDSLLLREDGGFRGVHLAAASEEGQDPGDLLCDGLFVAIGHIPENKPFKELAELDQAGYFASGENCRTRTSGLFVAGDCRQKKVRQLTTAVADGAVAALAACDYLNGI